MIVERRFPGNAKDNVEFVISVVPRASGLISTRPMPGKGGCADWIEDVAIDGERLGRSRGG